VGFVASPSNHLTSIEASASVEPFLGKERIQGFFNTIDPELPFKVGRVNEQKREKAILG
jgi:hypothetical protein